MLGGHKHNLVCTRTQEKGAVTPQKTDTDLSGSVQEPPLEAWFGGVVACCRVGGSECGSTCMGSFGGGCHYLHCSLKVKSLSHVRHFATPWIAAYQAPLSMGFSRQECWSELPFNDILNSKINLQLAKNILDLQFS